MYKELSGHLRSPVRVQPRILYQYKNLTTSGTFFSKPKTVELIKTYIYVCYPVTNYYKHAEASFGVGDLKSRSKSPSFLSMSKCNYNATSSV